MAKKKPSAAKPKAADADTATVTAKPTATDTDTQREPKRERLAPVQGETCPACGSRVVGTNKDGYFECADCGAEWSLPGGRKPRARQEGD